MFRLRHGAIRAVVVVMSILLAASTARSQAENVPAHDPVYAFLKTMEVKGIIDHYADAVLPLSRAEVARYLHAIDLHRDGLSVAEQDRLNDYLSEYSYELTGSVSHFDALISASGDRVDSVGSGIHPGRERVAVLHADSVVTLFLNGLVSADTRHVSGDALGSVHTQFLEVGVRARGTLLGHLGYTFRMTNAQFWGSRELLSRDERIAQSHALSVGNIQNFDFAEGSVRYDAGIISAQIGRERILWGTSVFDEKMVLSDHPRAFDYIRADAAYGVFRYTFMHAWILGSESRVFFYVGNDSSSSHSEPVIADKYFAAHRFGLSFPGVVDLGFQEMVVYSNRSVDLAYLSPLSFIESTQRSRGERDNVMWVFDLKTLFLKNLQFTGTILYDDINVPDMFSDLWTDRYAWQVGLQYADPFTIPNTGLKVEYTRVEPYVFSHGRSRDDNFTSLGRILGPAVGPNGDAWQFGVTVTPRWNLSISGSVLLGRHGMNYVNPWTGELDRNFGSDPLVPHRNGDPEHKVFLAGSLQKTLRADLQVVWEPVNGLWVEAAYRYESLRYPGGIQYFTVDGTLPAPWADSKNHFASLNVRCVL
jgi:hypothetical protein